MIEIYFNDDLTPFDSDNYLSFDYEYQAYDKEFYLGSVASYSGKLVIPSASLPAKLQRVKVKIDNKDYLHFIVDDIIINDNAEAEISLKDILLNTEVKYDISDSVPITAINLFKKICNDFSIPTSTTTFTNEDVEISSYDSELTARDYLSMIAELAGGYMIINSEGELNLKTFSTTSLDNINYDEVDSYKLGEEIEIQRVVYSFEDTDYQSSRDENLYTLYLNSNNLFLQLIDENQFNAIVQNILGLKFNNITIETTNKFFIGNQLLNFTDESNTYIMLNQMEASYNGGFIGSYKNEIDTTKKNATSPITQGENIKRIRQLINQEEAKITTILEDTFTIKDTLANQIYTKSQVDTIIRSASEGITNTFTTSGGQNLLRNTAPYFMESDNTAEFWEGNVKQGREENSTSGFALLLQDNTITQNVTLKKATYTIKFFYKKLISLSKLKVEYNGRIIEIDDTSIKLNGETLVFTDGKYETESILIDTNEKSIKTTGEVSTGNMILKITCDTNNGFEIYDLMLNFGDVFIPWSQNANESTSDTVNISKGITVSSNTTNTIATMKSDGFKVRNKTTNEEIMSATDTGGLFKDITSTGVSKLSGLIIQQIGDEIWITGGGN